MAPKPNLFLVGSAKAGTSSLYEYLKMHPDVFMSRIKEPHYFCSHHFPKQFFGPGDRGFSEGVVRAEQSYFDLFADAGSYKLRGEASVYYLLWADVAKRLRDFHPGAKILAVLRNPVERAYSAYLHTVRDGRETLNFEDALSAEADRKKDGYQPLWWYKEVGLYSHQVEAYLRVFDEQHIRILLNEDLRDTERTMCEVFEFLGVDPDVPIDTSVNYNVSGVPKARFLYEFFAKPNPLKNVLKPLFPAAVRERMSHKAKAATLKKTTMNEETREVLKNYYRKDIQRLEGIIHRDLSHWLK